MLLPQHSLQHLSMTYPTRVGRMQERLEKALAKQKDEKEALQAKSIKMEAENLRQSDQLDHLRAKMQWNEAWLFPLHCIVGIDTPLYPVQECLTLIMLCCANAERTEAVDKSIREGGGAQGPRHVTAQEKCQGQGTTSPVGEVG